MEKAKYKTKQRDELLAYLENAQGTHVTVNDITEYFSSQGKRIGKATIYRHLEKMVDEGKVNKYTIDSNSSACFEYIGDSAHSEDVCFHYKCEECSKLMHMHCDEFAELRRHLLAEHQFTLDPMRTVFYGICKECREKKKNESEIIQK